MGSTIQIEKGESEPVVVVEDGEDTHTLSFPTKTGTFAVDSDTRLTKRWRCKPETYIDESTGVESPIEIVVGEYGPGDELTGNWIQPKCGNLTGDKKPITPEISKVTWEAETEWWSDEPLEANYAYVLGDQTNAPLADDKCVVHDTGDEFITGHKWFNGEITIGSRWSGQEDIGMTSFVQGEECDASGAFASANGQGSDAQGDYSHAEGMATTTMGDYSHAEGGHTYAIGENSHAEGEETTAAGDLSHTDGYRAVSAESGHDT